MAESLSLWSPRQRRRHKNALFVRRASRTGGVHLEVVLGLAVDIITVVDVVQCVCGYRAVSMTRAGPLVTRTIAAVLTVSVFLVHRAASIPSDRQRQELLLLDSLGRRSAASHDYENFMDMLGRSRWIVRLCELRPWIISVSTCTRTNLNLT